MNHKKIEYKTYAKEHGIDFKDIYNRKVRGESWTSLADGVSLGTMQSMMEDFCKDNGYNYEALKIRGAGIICDVGLVDEGRVKALRKAHWSIKDIAVDCHCTTECVEQILYGDDNEDNTEELRKYYNDTRL